jgi:phage repressor protein C with HTH and peptisase S24 domain
MQTDLRDQLIAYVKKSPKQATEIAKDLGIDYQRFSKWLQKKSSPKDEEDRKKIRELVSGTSNSSENNNRINTDEEQRITKFKYLFREKKISSFDKEPSNHSGTISVVDNTAAIIMEYIDAPFIGFVEGVVEVSGESMNPTLKSGDRLAIKQLPDMQLLLWGELYYIIDKNLQGVVKRVYEFEGGIEMMSDHQDQRRYPPVKRKWNQIEAIFKVKADITKH